MRLIPYIVALTFVACVSNGGSGNFSDTRLSAAEELRIGSVDDPELSFTWFRDLEVGPDGTIYTIHPQEHSIRVHSPDGTPIRTIGGEGEGPGEFSRPGSMGMLGDTLWVLDHGLYRLSYFSLSGEVLAMQNIPIDLGDATYSPPRPTGLLADGTLRGASPAWSRLVASGEIKTNATLRIDSTCRIIDTIAVYSVENTSWEVTDPNDERSMASYQNQPFSDTEIVSVSGHMPLVVRVDRQVPSDVADATFAVTAVTFTGDTTFSRSYDYTPIPIDEQLIDSLIDRRAARVSSSPFPSAPTHDRAAGWARKSLYVPGFHPPVSTAMLGKDGSVWLCAEKLGRPTVDWRVISPTGEPVGTVTLPVRFRPMGADGDFVWGADYDEFDVPYIVRYRLTGG